jgi:hypothetical protein
MPHNFDEADTHESRSDWLANSWLDKDIARDNAQQLGELATECPELVAFGSYRIRIANTHIPDEPEFATRDIDDLHADFDIRDWAGANGAEQRLHGHNSLLLCRKSGRAMETPALRRVSMWSLQLGR